MAQSTSKAMPSTSLLLGQHCLYCNARLNSAVNDLRNASDKASIAKM
jgi:hypothetical protein